MPDPRAAIARMTAERFGCTDPRLLKLVERLACSSLKMYKPNMQGDSLVLDGEVEGKAFKIELSGPALADFT